MLTREQIREIAQFPEKQDFRFRMEYGQTIVEAALQGGGTLRIYEDGSAMRTSADGFSRALWMRETMPLDKPAEIV